jgi:hypothetical protein
MPQLEYFLVAESAAVDQMTNRVSIFNVMEDLPAAQLPSIIPHLAVVAAWNFTPAEVGAEFQVHLRIVSPGAEPRDQYSHFRATRRRQRVFNVIVGLPVATQGDIVFTIALNGQHQATHTMSVVLVDAARPAGTQPN